MTRGLVLALTAGLVFLWLPEFVRESVALAGSLLFGLNPCSVILVGMPHHSLLHLFTLVAACLLAIHSLTWMDLMYYHVKLPLPFAFASFFVDRAHRWGWQLGRQRLTVGAALNVPLLASGLVLSAWVL